MELEIRHLKLLEAIAEEGTMTRAGMRLHLSQSALSHQLSSLEGDVGASLFRRVPRGMMLTGLGEQLLGRGKVILRELKLAQEELKAAVGAGQGPLRISTECYTCYHWLPARVKAFRARFPQVDVQIVAAATRSPVEALLAGTLDLAVVSFAPNSTRLECRELFEDELVAIISPEHPLAQRAYLQPGDFAAEHLLTYSVPPSDLTIFQEFLIPAGVTPASVSTMDLTEAIVEMVKAGLGISVMARWAVARQLHPSSLKAMKLGKRGFTRKWYAVTLKSKRPPAYVDAFVELLHETWQ